MFLKLLTLFLFCKYVFGSEPEIALSVGKVQGYYKNTISGKEYTAFEGIPYARPPVGKYRFEEAKPYKPWFGTWQAKTLTKCMQYLHYKTPEQDDVIGDEDCLHINVYIPKLNDGKLRDVIIFIHGGAFMFNSGDSYGEKYLMEHDVIYVTFNYRLGPLGFLSTEDRFIPGNNGLKDQLLALRWVKENIGYFGGNANNILITGMSAGGVSVHIHTLSPRTQDLQLFHKAIVQSGTALNPWALVEKSREKTIKLGSLIGCPENDTKEMIKCMKHRPAKQIVASVKHFQPWLYNPFSPFGVVVDKWADNPVLPVHPYKVLKNKERILNIPIIFSNVQSEGLYPGAEFIHHLPELERRWNSLIPFVLDFNNTVNPELINEVNEKIRRFYLGDQKLTKETYPTLIKLITDRLFVKDIEKASRLHAAAISEPVYYYFYSYRGATSKSDARTMSNENYGSSHGDDTIMVLSTNINTTSTVDDIKMSNILQNMWLSFGKTSVPSVSNITWNPISNKLLDPLNYLQINSPSNIKMESAEYLANRVNFWDQLPIDENQNLKVAKDEL